MFNVRRHWNYFKYLIRHKYYVFIGIRVCGGSPYRALVHDMSKCLPSEWSPYASTFYKPDGSGQYTPSKDFNIAWLKHIHRNKHHWQYWILRMDSGETIPQEIPQKYVREMVGDWMGAGKAITGRWEVGEWYDNNKYKMRLHPKTKDEVDALISVVREYPYK